MRALLCVFMLLLAHTANAQQRIAVLEFSGDIDGGVLAQLTDEARGGAQRVLREAGKDDDFLVMSRESMASFIQDAGDDMMCVEGAFIKQ